MKTSKSQVFEHLLSNQAQLQFENDIFSKASGSTKGSLTSCPEDPELGLELYELSRNSENKPSLAWIGYGLLGGALYGVGNMFIKEGVASGNPLNFLGVCIGLMPPALIQHWKFSTKDSPYTVPETGMYRKENLLGLALRTAQSQLQMTCNCITLSLAIAAGQNPAALSSLYALQIVFTALLFYFLFGESLKKGHFIGIAAFLASVFMVAAGSNSSSTGTSSFWSSASAIAVALTITAQNFLVRYWKKQHGFPTIQLILDSCFCQGLLLLPFYAYFLKTGEIELSTSLLFSGFGFLSVAGAAAMSLSVSKGKAGPASALMQSSIVVFLFLMFVINGQIPNFTEFVAIALGIIGTLAISLQK